MKDKSKYPEPIVGALVFNQEEKLFLMTSPKWKGKYTIPGGHIEFGETIENAIKREIKEETNLSVFDINFFSVQEFVLEKRFHEEKHFIFLDYVCKTSDTEVILNEEGTDFLWITPEEALKLPIISDVKTLILNFIGKRK